MIYESAVEYIEGKDYSIIPVSEALESEGNEFSPSWLVRSMTGDYIETVFQFGAISIDGTDDDPLMSFDFTVHSSPIEGLSAEDKDMQQYAGDILLSIIKKGLENNTVAMNDVK